MNKQVHGQYGARSNAREEADWYPSPEDVMNELLENTDIPVTGPVLDAGAGTGILMQPLLDAGIEVAGVELHDRGAPAHLNIDTGIDFLEIPLVMPGTGEIVMNPPFKQADDFVRHALGLLEPGGRVRALMRLTWMAAKRRADLLPQLEEVLIMGRLKMLPAGRQDLDKGHNGSVDFAFFTFTKGHCGSSIKRV